MTANDPQQVLDGLAETLPAAMPPGVAAGAVEVRRERSLADRLAGRPGRVESLKVADPGTALTLTIDSRGVRGEVARVSGGVTISRKAVGLGEWLRLLSDLLAELAASAAGDSAAASRALVALGLAPAAVVTVSEADLATDLAALPTLLAGRVPEAALPVVTRITAAIRDALPRVAGSGEPEIALRRTATVYLPDTLRAYLALPADWATTHTLPDGTTPAAALLAQLDRLDTAVATMRDAALAQDATQLAINGRFLADRFSTSALDL